MTVKVFLNEDIVDIDKACISVTDSGFLYGTGLFETMRSYGGTVFAVDDHLDRLQFSAEKLGITIRDKDFMKDAIYRTLEVNELTDARLRLTVSNGPVSGGGDSAQSTFLVTAAAFEPYPKELYKHGVLVVICPFRQNPMDPTYGHKTINYFPRMVGLRLAKEKRAVEALWFTVENKLAEGCISNIFLVKDSVVYTPPVHTPILAGVTRQTLCQLALENNIDLVEKDLYIDDVLGADEMFLTNVVMEVMPINSVEKHKVGSGKVGPITHKLTGYYRDCVKDYCGGDR